jgi:hypothetical protein
VHIIASDRSRPGSPSPSEIDIANSFRTRRHLNPAVETAFGPRIPRTLDEACDPRRMALLVYDVQVGVVDKITMSAFEGTPLGAVVCDDRRADCRIGDADE